MSEDDEDRQKAIDAEMKHRFIEDSTRLVDQMGIETARLVKPVRERRSVNHFFEDWDARFRGKASTS